MVSPADRTRQRRWKAAQHERGRVRLQLWVLADQVDRVRAFVATLTPPQPSQDAQTSASPGEPTLSQARPPGRPENAPGATAAVSPGKTFPQPPSPLQRAPKRQERAIPEAVVVVAFRYRPNAALQRELRRQGFEPEDDARTWESPILPAIEIEALRAWAAALKSAAVTVEPVAE